MPASAQSVAQQNDLFLVSALDRNYPMPSVPITQVGQTLDIELDQVPGWAYAIDLDVFLDILIAVAAGGAVPSLSQVAPWNAFRSVEVSMGGGPFQRVSPYFYFLREKVMHPGWDPTKSDTYSVPALAAAVGSSEDNYWRFKVRVPLQVQHGSIYGHLPMGNSSVRVKIRLYLQNSLWGADQYQNPLYGGSAVTATIGTTEASWVKPSIWYRTNQPVSSQALPTPTIGRILNIQEKATSFTGAGSLTPIKFPDPFVYMRLWHLVQDGTGAFAGTSEVNQFEFDLTPGYPQFSFPDANSLQEYLYTLARLYRQDLPPGLYVFDFWSGNNPENPNGTQTVDASLFQTMQTQLGVTAGTNVTSPAKIVTYAEALSPVGF